MKKYIINWIKKDIHYACILHGDNTQFGLLHVVLGHWQDIMKMLKEEDALNKSGLDQLNQIIIKSNIQDTFKQLKEEQLALKAMIGVGDSTQKIEATKQEIMKLNLALQNKLCTEQTALFDAQRLLILLLHKYLTSDRLLMSIPQSAGGYNLYFKINDIDIMVLYLSEETCQKKGEPQSQIGLLITAYLIDETKYNYTINKLSLKESVISDKTEIFSFGLTS